MLDLKEVAKNFEAVVERLKLRGGSLDLAPVQALVHQRRELYIATEALSHKRNLANEEMKKRAKEAPESIDALRGELRAVSQELKEKEAQLKSIEESLENILYRIPNIPHPSVPVGTSEADNRVERTWGERPNLLFTPRQHFEIGEQLGMLDFERAAKVSGSRFAFYKGPLARRAWKSPKFEHELISR